MDRAAHSARLARPGHTWDVVVIGAGATGLGVALDAAARGYETLCVDQSDFAKATSSRSTKLIHGGVRYLEQGDLGLVTEALRERGRLVRNAPHLVFRRPFVVPSYRFGSRLYYGVGLKLYDRLAGALGLGRSIILTRDETLARLPTVRREGLRGGVLYYDGQFDDARLALALARTAAARGATLLNYARVTRLLHTGEGEGRRLFGLDIQDQETGITRAQRARVVINATGIFADRIRQLDDRAAPPLMARSQGIHLVFDRDVLPGDTALLVPRTRDGRVIFAVPWHGKLLVGTTETAVDEPALEPTALEAEVEFILEHVRRYFEVDVTREHVRSVFCGIRPLVRRGAGDTKKLSRTHRIETSPTGLVSILGGKWTTYRQMAEDTVDRAIEVGGLDRRPCVTAELRLHGHSDEVTEATDHLSIHGSDLPAVHATCAERSEWQDLLHPRLPYRRGEVIWAVRHEMARTIDDVLARRLRALVLDAEASVEAAPDVARLMAEVLGWDEKKIAAELDAFAAVADHYRASTAFG